MTDTSVTDAVATDAGGRPPERAAREARIAWALWGIGATCASVIVVVLGRGTTFYYDEWQFVVYQRSGLASLFQPHNGHWSTVPTLLYWALFYTVGLGHYLVYRLVGVAVLLICSALVFAYCRRRVRPLLAAALAASVLFLGDAWQDLLWPFQIGFVASLALGIAVLLLLDGDSRRNDRLACVALTVSLASSGIGVAFVAGVALELVVGRNWRRGYVVVVPLCCYLAWYLGFGGSPGPIAAVSLWPSYVVTAGGGVFASLLGVSETTGKVLLVVLGVLVVVGLLRPGGNRARRFALAAVALVFWASLAATRATGGQPIASRYLLPGAVFVVLLVAELASRVRIPLVLVLGATALLAFGAVEQAPIYRDGGAFLRWQSSIVRAELGVVQLTASAAPPHLIVDDYFMPGIAAGPYLAAERALGSPADSYTQLLAAPEIARAGADAVLARVLGTALLRPVASADLAAPGAPPTVTAVRGGRLERSASCLTLVPLPHAEAALTFSTSGGAFTLRSGRRHVLVALRRFASRVAGVKDGVLAPHELDRLSLPALGIARPWVVRLRSRTTLELCGARDTAAS